MKKLALLVVLLTNYTFIFSQENIQKTGYDFQKPIEALKQGFQKKDYSLLKEHLSVDFKVGQFNRDMAHQVIPQIIAQYPKLISLDLKSFSDNKATLVYNFEAVGESTSAILFSENGKIKQIEFLDNMMKNGSGGSQKSSNSSRHIQKNYDEKLEDNSKDIEFPSLDGITISAELYEIDKTSPIIVLCHQANYNKYEYKNIAIKLNELGFNCLALDQRSGGVMQNANNDQFINETFERAKKSNLPTTYVDAEQDIIAAINYAGEKFKESPLILWGSSYSSALALFIALENNNVDAVLSFSPGEYLAQHKGFLEDKLPNLKIPAFITSSKREIFSIEKLLSKTTLQPNQVHFKPQGAGEHGSKALWPKQEHGEEYWNALTEFLTKTKKMLSHKK